MGKETETNNTETGSEMASAGWSHTVVSTSTTCTLNKVWCAPGFPVTMFLHGIQPDLPKKPSFRLSNLLIKLKRSFC